MTLSRLSVGWVPNSVFIEGDRGAGKTTFLLNITNYLRSQGKGKSQGADDQQSLYDALKFYPLIDPTLLESNKNMESNKKTGEALLISVVAMLLNSFQEDIECFNFTTYDPDNQERDFCYKGDAFKDREGLIKEIYRIVEGISRSLQALQDDKQVFALEQIANQQAGWHLDKSLHKLFFCLTKFYKKKALVLMIDDTDMAMNRCFEILDTILRFFSSPHLIILISGQKSLYDLVLKQYFCKSLPKEGPQGIQIPEQERQDKIIDTVSTSYFEKIFPTHLRIHLDSISQLIQKRSVYIESDQDARIPLRVLQEFLKKLLYRGLAIRHSKAFFIEDRKHLTVRTALQRLKFMSHEIHFLTSKFLGMLKEPKPTADFYFKHYYTEELDNPKNNHYFTEKPGKDHSFYTQIQKVQDLLDPTKEGSCNLVSFEDYHHVIQALLCQFLAEYCPKRNCYEKIITSWKNQGAYIHKEQGAELSYLERDFASISRGTFSTYEVFTESLKQITRHEDEIPTKKTKKQFLNTFEIDILRKRIDPPPQSGMEAFYASLFFRRVPDYASSDVNVLATAQPLIELLMLSFNQPLETTDIFPLLELDTDGEGSNILEEVRHYVDNEKTGLRREINDWRETNHLHLRVIGSLQMDLIVGRTFDDITLSFKDEFPFRDRDYSLAQLSSDIIHIFLNAVALTEKEKADERSIIEHDIHASQGNVATNRIVQFNVNPPLGSYYLSLTRIFRRHPVIKKLLEDDTKKTLEQIKFLFGDPADDLSRKFTGLVDYLKDLDESLGTPELTQGLDDFFKQYKNRMGKEDHELFVKKITRSPGARAIFQAMGIKQIEQFFNATGISAQDLPKEWGVAGTKSDAGS